MRCELTKVTIVVAMNKENVIGVDNKLPWHIPEDLQHFKLVTYGKPVIMGRKTFESIGRVLPQRTNIVITRNRSWQQEGVELYSSIDDALKKYAAKPEICVIGGGDIFQQTIDLANTLHVTIIDLTVDNAEVFFPKIDENIWQLTATQAVISKNGIHCSFNEYNRKS